ncbi:MAG: hypothetical protein K2L66_05780, partial [Paramuribaculum sp.]|nr:hypothetical protein [Paramuribaculum sp.]
MKLSLILCRRCPTAKHSVTSDHDSFQTHTFSYHIDYQWGGYSNASETDSLAGVGVDKTLDYRLKERPRQIDNYLYSIFAAADANVYNLRGFPIGKIKKTPLSLKVNPAGHSYGLLTGDDKSSQLEIAPIGTSKV